MSQAPKLPVWRIEPWAVQLHEAQAVHIRSLAQNLMQAQQDQPGIRAWLVLDGWQDNVAGAWLQERYPAWVEARHCVPDPAFRGQESWAPCLLSLDDWADHERDHGVRRDALHDLLGLMWLDTQRRLVRQHVCGVLFSQAPVDEVMDHWLLLAYQRTPDGQNWHFRHQDPRVLQRVWPSLSTSQRNAWLGPVHSLWQLAQPWGPWSPQDFSLHEKTLLGEGPVWHVAMLTERPATTPMSLRMTHAQLQILEELNAPQMLWESMARAGVSRAHQPSPDAMVGLCGQMRAWRAMHPVPWSDEQACAWLWCTCLGQHSSSPIQAKDSEPIDWTQSPWAERGAELERRLCEQPDLDLRMHFENLMASKSLPVLALAA